ncbi:hypothetical protein RJ641_027115 [Dillenia turbinata]|uniref:Uncharacterized protein n=1 Tax=Dillenia turbinata TaxID=194707 RepID=A0AAN8VVK3_9MAGN
MDCGSVKKVADSLESMRSRDFIVEDSVTKPLWQHLSEESFLAKLDPNVVSSYRQALSSRQLGFNQSGRIQPVVSSVVLSALPDERDISMHSTFRKELQDVLGEKMVSLPQILIEFDPTRLPQLQHQVARAVTL